MAKLPKSKKIKYIWYSIIYKESNENNGSRYYILEHCLGTEASSKQIDEIYSKKRKIVGVISNSKYYQNDLEKIVKQANEGEIDEEQLKTLIKFIQQKIKC